MRVLDAALTGLLGLLVLALIAVLGCGVRLNLSPSVPIGLYRLHRVPGTLTRGMLVVFPVPVSVQPWHSAWIPLLKPIAGLPGDTVCWRPDHTFWVNRTVYAPVLETSDGQVLPQHTGCQIIPEGSLIVASHAPPSLDSRYFGPVALQAVSAMARPIWVRHE